LPKKDSKNTSANAPKEPTILSIWRERSEVDYADLALFTNNNQTYLSQIATGLKPPSELLAAQWAIATGHDPEEALAWRKRVLTERGAMKESSPERLPLRRTVTDPVIIGLRDFLAGWISTVEGSRFTRGKAMSPRLLASQLHARIGGLPDEAQRQYLLQRSTLPWLYAFSQGYFDPPIDLLPLLADLLQIRVELTAPTKVDELQILINRSRFLNELAAEISDKTNLDSLVLNSAIYFAGAFNSCEVHRVLGELPKEQAGLKLSAMGPAIGAIRFSLATLVGYGFLTKDNEDSYLVVPGWRKDLRREADRIADSLKAKSSATTKPIVVLQVRLAFATFFEKKFERALQRSALTELLDLDGRTDELETAIRVLTQIDPLRAARLTSDLMPLWLFGTHAPVGTALIELVTEALSEQLWSGPGENVEAGLSRKSFWEVSLPDLERIYLLLHNLTNSVILSRQIDQFRLCGQLLDQRSSLRKEIRSRIADWGAGVHRGSKVAGWVGVVQTGMTEEEEVFNKALDGVAISGSDSLADWLKVIASELTKGSLSSQSERLLHSIGLRFVPPSGESEFGTLIREGERDVIRIADLKPDEVSTILIDAFTHKVYLYYQLCFDDVRATIEQKVLDDVTLSREAHPGHLEEEMKPLISDLETSLPSERCRHMKEQIGSFPTDVENLVHLPHRSRYHIAPSEQMNVLELAATHYWLARHHWRHADYASSTGPDKTSLPATALPQVENATEKGSLALAADHMRWTIALLWAIEIPFGEAEPVTSYGSRAQRMMLEALAWICKITYAETCEAQEQSHGADIAKHEADLQAILRSAELVRTRAGEAGHELVVSEATILVNLCKIRLGWPGAEKWQEEIDREFRGFASRNMLWLSQSTLQELALANLAAGRVSQFHELDKKLQGLEEHPLEVRPINRLDRRIKLVRERLKGPD
jgi:hypothetical protein